MEEPKKRRPHPTAVSLANLRSWKPGQSGNPTGSSRSQRLRDRAGESIESVLDVVVAAALAGDISAARLVLERCIPAMKAVEEPVHLQLPEGGTLADKARAVIHAVARGEIAPGQAAQLVSAIGSVASIATSTELLERLERLERQLAMAPEDMESISRTQQ